MKPFSQVLAELNGGESNAMLTQQLEEVLQAVKKHGRGAALTVKIKVNPASKGGTDVDKILVACDSQVTLPKPEQPTDFFWLTDDADISRKHPRQRELELRDVSSQGATNAPLTPEATFAVAVANGAPPLQTFTPPDADGVIQPLATAPTTFKEI